MSNLLKAAAMVATVSFVLLQSVGAAEGDQLSPALTNVVKMVKSGVGEDVVVAYVKDAAITKPTAEEIIYLHEAGVPRPIVMALLAKPEVESTNGKSQDAIKKPTYLIPAPVPLYAAPSVPLGARVETASIAAQPEPAVYLSSPRVIVYDRPVYFRHPHCDDRPAISFGVHLGRHGHHSIARRR